MMFANYIFPEVINLQDKEQYEMFENIVEFFYALVKYPENISYAKHLYLEILPVSVFNRIDLCRENRISPTSSERYRQLSYRCIYIIGLINAEIYSFYDEKESSVKVSLKNIKEKYNYGNK